MGLICLKCLQCVRYAACFLPYAVIASAYGLSHKFAEALEVVPRTLAENAGEDSTAVVSELTEKYATAMDCGFGVDIENGGVGKVVNEDRPVLDLYAVKKNGLRLAVNAVLTILKVDQIIMAKEAGGPKLRPPQKDVE